MLVTFRFAIYKNFLKVAEIYGFSDYELAQLKTNLTWLGEKCISHENRIFPAEDKYSIPRWRRVMNLSISCFITSLIIISAGLLLGIVGVLYKQAACILVDSVLFQLAVFFSIFGIAIHFTNRLERRPDLGCVCGHPSVCPALSYWTGWSQHMGLGGVALCAATAVQVYGLARVIITMITTIPEFK